jgi:hypothetical protein
MLNWKPSTKVKPLLDNMGRAKAGGQRIQAGRGHQLEQLEPLYENDHPAGRFS